MTTLVTVLLALGLLWTITATLREGFLPGEYAMWKAKQQMIADCRLPGTVIIGDSRAVAGFIPGEIPDTLNLAMGGATPIELYYTATRMLACPQAPKRVVLSVSIPQFTRTPWFWQRSAMFGFLSFADLEEIRKRSRALHDPTLFAAPTIGDFDAILGNWLYSHQFPSFYSAYLIDEGVVGRLGVNRRIGQTIEQSGGQHLYGTDSGSTGKSDDGDDKQFHPAPILDDYLRRMLAMFAARGTEVLFMGVPMNQATFNSIAPEAAAGFRAYIASLPGQFANFHLAGDPLPHWDNQWFGDSTHLNAAGAALFSAQAAQRLGTTP